MPFLELFDETLDINATGNYELIVQVSATGVTFCILDSIREKFILIRSSEADQGKSYNPERLSEILTRDDFLSRQYLKVSVILPSGRYALVPSALFDPDRKDEYHSQSFVKDEKEAILTCRIPEPDLSIVYGFDRELLEMLGSHFPSAVFMHSLKPLLMTALSASGRTAGNYICLNCESGYFDLIVFSNSRLKFCNSFNCRGTSDILYYTMNVLNKIQAGRDDTINLSGSVSKNDALFTGLNVYFRNIRTALPPANYAFSYVFGDVEMHRYMKLFLAAGCG